MIKSHKGTWKDISQTYKHQLESFFVNSAKDQQLNFQLENLIKLIDPLVPVQLSEANQKILNEMNPEIFENNQNQFINISTYRFYYIRYPGS